MQIQDYNQVDIAVLRELKSIILKFTFSFIHLGRFRAHHRCQLFLEWEFVAPRKSTAHAGYRQVVGRSGLKVEQDIP